MAFELRKPTNVEFYNVNVRSEFHGEEHVRAVDIGIRVKGENTLLDLLKPGLREHHFCSTATNKGQQALPLTSLPNIRHPELPTKGTFAKGERWRGYHFVYNAGPGALGLDFEDCALTDIAYEFFEGGSTEIKAVVQYNGEKLGDDATLGRCAGLSAMAEGRVQLTGPGEVLPIEDKHWRSGASGEDGEGGGRSASPPAGVAFHEDSSADTESDVIKPGTPEAALAGAVAAEGKPANGQKGDGPWPFPDAANGTRKRGNRRAAAA